jgi:hypothetical protein
MMRRGQGARGLWGVASFSQSHAMKNGWCLEPDEPLQWYWAPVKDHPPFQELVEVR